MHTNTNELTVIMATQFVKWWKTKFHAGGCSYKSISVLGSNVCDGRPSSDTEELVRDDASATSAYNNGAHINPGLASSTVSEASLHLHHQPLHNLHHHSEETPDYLHQHSATTEVKFEDFECDVQVEGCGSAEERKEFSFTFYDFDGHGKITKDDIAGLVRSIYGAVNDSITVPHGGKKTIKVKLTVTPEKTQQQSSEINNENNIVAESANNTSAEANIDLTVSPSSPSANNINNNNNVNNNTTNNNNISAIVTGMGNGLSALSSSPDAISKSTKLRNNVNVTIKENLNRDRLGGGSGRKEKELRDRLSHLEHSTKPKFNSVRLPNTSSGCRGCRNLSPEVFRDCSASPLRNRKKWREKICSIQRPDIFEILQANMEKNNVNPCCRRVSEPHHHNNPSPLVVQQQHSMITTPCTHSQLISHPSHQDNNPVPNFLNLENSNNLLCKQNLSSSFIPSSAAALRHHYQNSSKVYDGTAGAVHHLHRSSHSHHHSHQHQCRKHGHHRSRSHDLGSQNLFRHHSLTERDHLMTCCAPNFINNSNNMFLEQQQQHQNDPLNILEGYFSPRNKNTNLANAANAAATTGNATTTTPHQLKHRNRQQEHERAMAQVISWLERENIGGCKDKFASSSPNRKNPLNNPEPTGMGTTGTNGSPPTVKKHEHHHVHEHIHHHYHHHFGKETPIIV